MKYVLKIYPPEVLEFEFDSSVVNPDSTSNLVAFGKVSKCSFPEILHYAELLGMNKYELKFIENA